MSSKFRNYSKMNNLLSKVTIIIPTYNRQKYALRNMLYWSNKGVTLHVLDGSVDSINDKELNDCGQNIFYHHIPEDIFSRMDKAKDLVDTKYAILLCDDELFIPSALAECVKFLDSSKETASCIGRCMAFKYENNDLLVTEKFIPIKKSEDRSNSIKKRILFKATNYLPSTYYALHRKKLFLTNLELINLISSSPYTGEIFIEYSNTIHGHSKVLDNLMWLRSAENEPISNESWNRETNLELWYHNYEVQSEVINLLNAFSKIISKSSGISQNVIKRYVIAGLNSMCAINYAFSDYKSLILSFRAMFESKVNKLLGNHMYSGYKNRYGWIEFDDYKNKILDPKKIIYNVDELSDIFQIIKDGYK